MKSCAALMLCFAATALGAFAQAPAPAPAATNDQSPVFKNSGSEEVLLDVVVRDKKGHLIKDLKPEDFSILDNGQKKSIKSFRLVEGKEGVSSTGGRTQLDPLRQIRLVTLIFHGLDQNGRVLCRDAAMTLIKSELGQNVYMSVLSIGHNLQAIQPFTNDRELLKKAIIRATGGANSFADDSAAIVSHLQQMVGPMQGGGNSLTDQVNSMSTGGGGTGAEAAPNGSQAADQAMAQMMLQMLTAGQEDASTDWGRNAIFALLNAVKEQYVLPGRKTILFFSSGFAVPQGSEQAFQNVISIANRSNVSFYSIDSRGLTIRSSNQDSISGLNNAAAASHSMPGQGVNTQMAKSQDSAMDSGKANTQDTLGRLAKETGGDLIANTNDFKNPVKKISEDIETYYEITYDPQIEKYDGSLRTIAVKTADADYRVQSRSSYFALPPSMTANGQVVLPYEVPLLKALDQKPLQRDFTFKSAGMHFRGAADAPTCDVVLDIPIGNLTLAENKAAGDFEGKLAYVAMVKDGKGTIIKKLRNEVALKITPDKLEAFKAGHFVYSEPFQVAPGRYTLEAAVLDGAGEKISARKSSFIVPAAGDKLSISSITVVRNMKPAEATANPNDPLLMEHQVVTPFVDPTIKKSEMSGLPFYVVVYADKASTDIPALVMEFSKDGQVLGNVPAQLGKADAQGRIQYVATAPLSSFEPGSYQVRFLAKQGGEGAAETVSFTLEP
jgi:VWFA-related protein